jgi:hypothetical protein
MRGMPQDRVTWHLENWAYFQRDRASDFGGGFNWRDGSGARSNSSMEFDAMVAEVDKRVADIVDVIVDDLPPIQSAAVKHMHLAAVFRMARASLDAAYALARTHLSLELARRGVE